ncbi:hypothetical protein AF332_25340 [Sporosarcina globispora]|uniref:Lipoprotein n=1 Tax=Sporosarcina globispora TaxID=1459 RepID=A0A0M0GJ50_SPOGL|nr:hypothetical protein [Sporosarcina globispora]KON89808.1 hypothetical protein AF332_25340 [Sporosarcina globispora]
MKNLINMIMIAMLSSVIAGCSSEINASLNTEEIKFEKEDKVEAEQNTAGVQTDGKERKDTVWLEEKSLYQMDATDGKMKYTVYLLAEDERRTILEEDSAKGKKGDSYLTGHYSVYLAEKGSKEAFKQDGLNDNAEMSFNPSKEQVYTQKMRNKTIISIFQSKGEGLVKGQLLAIKDGEVLKISTEKEVITSSKAKIKNINQKYLQTAQNKNDRWVISTWQFNEETLSMSLHDQIELQEDNHSDIDWMDLWLKEETLYYPFKNLALSVDAIEKAKQGILLGSPYPIGTNISEIKKSDPNYIMEGFGNGSPFVMYPEITYYFERETGNVTAISIPGQRVRTSIDEVIAMLGTPAEVREEMLSGASISTYMADKYTIEIISDLEGTVRELVLRKTKNHAEQ